MSTHKTLALEVYFWTPKGEAIWDYFAVPSVEAIPEAVKRRFPTAKVDLIKLVEIDDDGNGTVIIDYRDH